MSTKRKNLEIASALTPKDFGPIELYGIPHIRTRAIKDYEMEHFIRFIRNSGGGNFPRVQKKDGLKIANLTNPDASIMRMVTEKGFFLDGQGGAYMQSGGRFYDAGRYSPGVHGLTVPLVNKQKKKSQLQIA